MVTPTLIRASRAADLPLLGALEKAADAQFRAAGLLGVADAPAPAAAAYAGAHEARRLLTAWASADTLIGFVRLELLDGGPHLEQLSVDPAHQGRGVGTLLLQAAERWALDRGHPRMTLTTFRDVAWNGPFYARRGWVVVPEHEWGPELAAARRHERDLGLDAWPRQAMAKVLRDEQPGPG